MPWWLARRWACLVLTRLCATQTCLVMDEVDGMSGGDRGGMQELIALIKSTRVPIICIANDYYDRCESPLS